MTCIPQDVVEITGSTLCPTEIQVFINIAQCQIDSVTCSVTDACKDLACAQLAAHELCLSPKGDELTKVKREKVMDELERTYAVVEVIGAGISSTNFGQTANRLMRGCLADLDKTPIQLYAISEC